MDQTDNINRRAMDEEEEVVIIKRDTRAVAVAKAIITRDNIIRVSIRIRTTTMEDMGVKIISIRDFSKVILPLLAE